MIEKPLDGMRVLILEDEFLIALDVEQTCRDHGASEVTIARTLDGFDPCAAYDIAVLDVMLAGLPTFDVAEALVARRVPFIFATGYTEADDRFAAFAGVPVLTKPYGGQALIAALVAAIEGLPLMSGGV